ncbi:unnamed protein product [Caenorhabditis sp. 36 PRJEB53466]|nr:unnamed protein product [Caenorhabditis sp. 36 PRJEB53466]
MYLDTPEFLTLALHVLAGLAIPEHVFGAYCILFKTPDSMKSVKWPMLNFHFWSVFLDFGLSTLAAPLTLWPVFGGVPFGILTKYFNVPPAYQIYLLTSLIGVVAASILTIFEHRYYSLFTNNETNNVWRRLRIPFLSANYGMAITVLVYPCMNCPEQTSARQAALHILPKLPSYIHEEDIFVWSEDIWLIIILTTVAGLLVIFECLFFLWRVLRRMNLQFQQCSLSLNSYKLQQKFIRAIRIQIGIPIAILVGPMLYVAFSSVFLYYNQMLNNLCIIIASTHGLLSTITMLIIHKPYRDVCSGLFRALLLIKYCAIVAFLTNTVIIVLICFKSPKSLGNYKYLMICIAFFEFFYAVLDALTSPIFSCLFMLYFGFKSYRQIQLLAHLSTSSSSFRSLQIQLFLALIIQTIIPLALIHVPCGLVVLFCLADSSFETLGRLLCLTVAMYPAIDPLPNMLVIQPYRKALIGCLQKCMCFLQSKRNVETISGHFVTIPSVH